MQGRFILKHVILLNPGYVHELKAVVGTKQFPWS